MYMYILVIVMLALLLTLDCHRGSWNGGLLCVCVCLSVCLSVFKISGQLTTFELRTGLKLYQDQDKRQAFSKTFWL